MSKTIFNSIWKMSFPATILVAIMAFISAYLWYIPNMNFFSINIFIGIIIISFHVAGFNSFNSCFDITEDIISKPNHPLPSGEIGLRTALKTTLLILIIPLIISYFISFNVFILTLFFTIFAFFYSVNPPRLKKILLINTLIVSMSYSLFPWLLAWLIVAKNQFTIIPILITGGTFASIILKDFYDIKGDLSVENDTIPIIFGVKKSIAIIKYLTIIFSLLIAIYIWLSINSIFKIIMFIFPILYFKLGNDLDKKNINKFGNQLFRYMLIGSIIQILIGLLSFSE